MTRRPPRVGEGYTVGITIFVQPGGELGLYQNGLRQNVLFLYQLFRAAPGCRRVVLLNHGDGEFAGWPPELELDDVPVVRTAEIADVLDYVVVLGAAVEPDELVALRARGVRIIGYKGGNGAIISIEAMVARPPRADAERYDDIGLYDAIWMTPQHMASYAGWCRTLYRVPVHEVPQLWAPTFVANRARALNGRFGYRSGARPWQIGIMEPNITVMKTSHVPMLVCEAAYRRAPEAIAAVYVSNTWQHRDNPHFMSFANALSIVRDGTMSFEQRFVSADFLADYCDAVVVHQWENALNYLYYEVLHGGYPLIHNSPLLRDAGYRYDPFNAHGGGERLVEAFANHDRSIGSYRRATDNLLGSIAPSSSANIERHEQLLAQLD